MGSGRPGDVARLGAGDGLEGRVPLANTRWPAVAVRTALAAGLLLVGLPSGATYADSASQALAQAQAAARQPLVGHTVPALAHAAALRPTDPTRQLQLTVSLQPRNQAQLTDLLRQQRDAHAAGVRAYLTPEQYSQQFGPTQASVDAVTAFLRSQGLQVADVSANHLLVHASGTVADVERAFQVQLQDYQLDGRTVHAPMGDPSVPTALAGVIRGVIGLDDAVKQHPHLQRATHRSDVGSGPGGGYTPAELRTAYDINPLPTGVGQNVGVVEFDGYDPADIAVFTQQFGPASLNLVNHFIDNATITPTDGGGAGEVELDIEVLAGIAPGATQHIYIAPNSTRASIDLYNTMVSDNVRPQVISSSWGKCEAGTSAAEFATMDDILSQGAAQGQAFFSAAGDTGAFDCRGRLGDPLSVDYPGSDPHVVSVGGTALTTGPGGAYSSETVWNEGAGNGAGGGGLSTQFAMPSYQSGPGVLNSFSNGKREVPDVSADADPATGYAVYCTVAAGNACVDFFGFPQGWTVIGGTSAATPLWAGITADINQYLASQGKPGVGDPHATLYRLFNTQQSFLGYHDITQGDNLNYPATAGYDMASGIGTPDAWNLARDIAAGGGGGGGGGGGAGGGLLTTFSPLRLIDTRTLGGPIPSGASQCFQVAGQANVPADAAAVALNVTAVGQTGPGWLTVYPKGQGVPGTSTLNFDRPGNEYAIANGTIIGLGAGGQVCVNVGMPNNAPGSANVILDVTGYLPGAAGTRLSMLGSPQRLVDTRASGGSAIGTGTSQCFAVAGQNGVPADAAAVVLNVTAVGYPAKGWLTVYPNGQGVPGTSTLNFDTSEYAIANGAIMRIGTGGQVCVSVGTVGNAPGSSHVILDVTGYLAKAAAAQLPMLDSPQRAVDTRTVGGGAIGTGASRCFTVAGVMGVPSNATAVVLNLTAVGYGTKGWLTAYPAGQSLPGTSTLNFDTSEYAMANGAIIQVGSNGQVCVSVGTVGSAPGSSHVVIDVVGYLVP